MDDRPNNLPQPDDHRGSWLGQFIPPVALRQLCFPQPYRISVPTPLTESADQPPRFSRPDESPKQRGAGASREMKEMIVLSVELATCLWYLKTKHFKRAWEDESTDDDDARARRALGRIAKAVEALKRRGIQVEDPTGKRYLPGSEGTIYPAQFLETDGIHEDLVTETVRPVVYWADDMKQQGEVYVAVPKRDKAVKDGHGKAEPAKTAATEAPEEPGHAADQTEQELTDNNS